MPPKPRLANAGRSPLPAKKMAPRKPPESKPSPVSADASAKPPAAKIPPQDDVPEKKDSGEGFEEKSRAQTVMAEPAGDLEPDMDDMEEIEEEIEEEVEEEVEEEIEEEIEEIEEEETEEVEDFPPSTEVSSRVDDLRGLTSALTTFTSCWDDLQGHFDKIKSAMDTLAHGLEAAPPKPEPVIEAIPEEEEEEEEEEKQEIPATEEKKTDGGENSNAVTDLKTICERMLGRNLRRYIVNHILEIDQLREEVPKALLLAPDPPKFLLNCIGRFYLQGSKAYADPNATMIAVRRACVLVLEFFLLSGAVQRVREKSEASKSVDEEAKVAAVAWKNRLITEGGVSVASAIDALGLTLFIASFGIPSEFGSEILYDLFRMSDMKMMANILLKSRFVVEKLPDMIQDLVQREKYMAAADLVCGFGMQDKHPPLDLMSSFLIKTNTDANEERREGHTSLRSLRETTMNELSAYKSVLKCLEEYKLDSSPLSGFKIQETVGKLEREVSRLDKKMRERATHKRKAGEPTEFQGGEMAVPPPLLPGPIIHRPFLHHPVDHLPYEGYGERRQPPDVLPPFSYHRSWNGYEPPPQAAAPGRVATPERVGGSGVYGYEEAAGDGERYYLPTRPAAAGFLHRSSYLN